MTGEAITDVKSAPNRVGSANVDGLQADKRSISLAVPLYREFKAVADVAQGSG